MSYTILKEQFIRFLLKDAQEIFKDPSIQPFVLENFESVRMVSNSDLDMCLLIHNSVYNLTMFMRVVKKWSSYNASVENIRSFVAVFEGFVNLPEANFSIISYLLDHPAFFIVVTPYYQFGTLFDYIYNYKPDRRTLTEPLLFELVRKLLVAVETCHKRDQVLMSLKPEHIFILSPTSVSVDRLAKFKLHFQNYSENVVSENLEYMPPEVSKSEVEIGPGVDFWHLGVLMWAKKVRVSLRRDALPARERRGNRGLPARGRPSFPPQK